MKLSKETEKLPGKELLLKYSIPEENHIESLQGNHDIEIPLFVDMNAGIGGDIWPAANLFCNILTHSADYYTKFSHLLNGKTVLELGSGNGLISILLEKLFPLINSVTIS